MAKKVTRPPANAAPVIPAARPTKAWKFVGWICAVAIVATGATLGWNWYRLPARLTAALPAAPDLTGKPQLQAELISRAAESVGSHAHPLDGVAELGRLYHANGYADEAEACWRLLQRKQPREPRWSYYLADLRRAASDYDEVSALLERVVKLAPDYAPAWLWLAGLQFKTGHLETAEHYYQRRLTLVPGDVYALLGLARVAQQNGHNDDARRRVEQLVRDFPQFSTGHNLYAEMLSAAGDVDGARKQRFFGRETGRFRDAEDPWLDALNGWCYDFSRLCVLATIEQQTERNDKGMTLVKRAILLAPDNPIGYELLGGMYRKLGDPTKARDTFEEGLRRATTLKPSPMYYVNLSETYRMLKQPEEALRIVQTGLAQNRDQLELYDALGVAYADLNRQEEAVTAFREVLARNPNDSNSNYNLGMSLMTLGRQNEAHDAFKRALILQPTFMKALSLLGRWELEAGNLTEAQKYLEPLYESHPEMPEVRQMMIQWHLRAGALAEKNHDLPGAESHYREGIAIDAARAELQASLGVLYLIQGRINEALAPLEAFHRLQPNDPQSALFLGQVYLQLGRLEEAKRVLIDGEQLARHKGNAATAAHFQEILQSL